MNNVFVFCINPGPVRCIKELAYCLVLGERGRPSRPGEDSRTIEQPYTSILSPQCSLTLLMNARDSQQPELCCVTRFMQLSVDSTCFP